ncbi:MAG: alpha/beta hydrolase [Chlorobi bacterium]|nr:alpha/beta hydrolase [Chlorobiota bacterium]
MKKTFVFTITFLSAIFFHLDAQDLILPLWKNNIPNYRNTGETEKWDTSGIIRISNVQHPDIRVFLPSRKIATGRAVVICPGGGYHILAYDLEGTDIAKWLNSLGIAGIVLKYRLPVASCNIIPYKSPLTDVQRAIRIVRSHAEEWHIQTDKIGVMGFSAGGHLASTAGTHFDTGNPDATDPVDRFSCRPDFMILGYPVISMTDSLTHMGSKKALLGENPSTDLVHRFSNELQVTDQTPPAFIFLASDDKTVRPANSIAFYKALLRHHVPAEMLIYPFGGHGFGIAANTSIPGGWTAVCADWLKWISEGMPEKQ